MLRGGLDQGYMLPGAVGRSNDEMYYISCVEGRDKLAFILFIPLLMLLNSGIS